MDKQNQACAGCGNIIPDSYFLICSLCGQHYDLLCANVGEKFFRLMQRKKEWKCIECHSKMPKKDNSNTPVRSSVFVLDSEDDERNNVTTRIKKTKEKDENIHIDPVYAPIDDVTRYLEVVRTMIREELNGEVMERLTNKISKAVEACTEVTLHASFEKLNNRISSLELKLQEMENNKDLSARTQHGERPSPNNKLGASTKQMQSRPVVKEVPTVDRVPAKRKPEKSKNTSSDQTGSSTILISSPKIPPLMTTDNNTKVEEEEGFIEVRHRRTRLSSPHVLRGVATPGSTSLEENGKKIVKKVEETMPKPLKKVIIIADQQGKGLQPCLQSVLGSQFSISCFWKGGAKMLDVLNSFKTEIMSLSKEDYVVVVGGTNDTNPCEYKTVIRTWLNFITNTNIIICEVPFNKSLNEFMLNQVLSQLCEQHEYCTFLDLNYTNSYIPRKDKVTNISRYVLREILRIQNQGKYKDYILDACNKSTQTEDLGIGASNFTKVTPVLVNEDDKIATKNVTRYNDLDFFRV